MGSTLTNTQPKDTYKGILKTSDTTELSATAKYVSDGNGNDSPLALSTSAVGIGTSTPTATLDARIAGTTSGAVIKVGNVGTGDFGGLAVSDGGTYPVQLYGSSLAFLTGNSAYASATEKVRILAGGGITFNGDTAAANALDDYEEGTWTIVATPSSTGSITLDAGVNQGYYTKIGRQVTCTGLAEVSSVSSPTGTAVQFSVLPFAIAPRIAEYEMRIGGSVTYNGASILAVPYTGTETATFINVYIDASTVSAGNQFYFSFTYFV